MSDRSAPLQEWIRENWVTNDKAGWTQALFVRDMLTRFGWVSVIGEHTSKGCKLPVYQIVNKPGLFQYQWRITARENFYGWVVSVETAWPIDLSQLPDYPFKGSESDYMKEDTPARQAHWLIGTFAPYYAEGFPPIRCFERYQYGRKAFTFRLSTNHDLYMLVALLDYTARSGA